jgi:hypothetical protein
MPLEKQPEVVCIYETYLKCRHLYLPFTFDLRFLIAEHAITFYLNEKELYFELVNED